MDNLLEIEIVILWGLKNGKTIKEIAKYTNRTPSTIEMVKERYIKLSSENYNRGTENDSL